MDYDALGLLVGLEIHQQLDTGKLFCHCPGYLRSDAPHFTVMRKLHAVAGETGEVDTAAAYEKSLDKTFVYEGYHDSTCLVELDEEPPYEINQSALAEALKIAFLLNCEVYQTTQIMRKTVINGSNTSGFQRTVLIGHSGWIETSFGKVPIEGVFLEEDSARTVEKDEKTVTYRLDRLGIPLVEITTAPVMTRPEQVKEAALKIGEILRACKVKRGIGTIRQDVNVNIKKHDIIEIKGFQDPRMMVVTIDKEIVRQQANLKSGKSFPEVRNALPTGETEFLRPMPGRARMYPETDLPLLKLSRSFLDSVKKNLPKLRDELRAEMKKKGLSEQMIDLVLDLGAADEFFVLARVYPKDVTLVAKMITLWRKDIGTKLGVLPKDLSERLSERHLEEVLEAVANGTIGEGDVRGVMEKLAAGESLNAALRVEKVSDDEVEEEIRKIVKEKPGLRPNAYMGLVMARFKGKLDARKAMELILRATSNGN